MPLAWEEILKTPSTRAWREWWSLLIALAGELFLIDSNVFKKREGSSITERCTGCNMRNSHCNTRFKRNTHWVILCMNDCEAMLPRSYFMETTGSWAHLMKELSHCQDYALAFAASSYPTISQLCHSSCGAITWPVIHSWGRKFLDKKKLQFIWKHQLEPQTPIKLTRCGNNCWFHKTT